MITGKNHWLIGILAAELIIVGGGIGCASDNATYLSDNQVASTSKSFLTPAENSSTSKPATTKPKPKSTENSTTSKPPIPTPPPPPPPNTTCGKTTCNPYSDPALTGPYLNQSPSINKIIFNNGTPVTITPNTAVPALECPIGTECTITCLASGADPDKLTYAWFASGGRILGQGNKGSWTAPGMGGIYKITVTVRDVNAGLASFSIMVKVTYSGK